MSADDRSQAQVVASSFRKTLERHGYAFQYSALRKVDDLAERGGSCWRVSVSEFPVEVQGSGTRIDFVLENVGKPLYMIVECKRANPALSNWCFVKIPEVLVDPLHHGVFAEVAHVSGVPTLVSATQHLFHSDEVYHHALEVKTDDKGDPGGKGRGAIEEAATQVCRGLNGLLDLLTVALPAFRTELKNADTIGFLPAIFTTARLWVSSTDITLADLETGRLSSSELELEERKWLYYYYHQSPGLKHSVGTGTESKSLNELLYKEYVRTIAIVNASGLGEFLSLNAWKC